MKINKIAMATGCGLLMSLCACNLDEVYYSEATPDTFITSEANIYSLMSRVLVHWKVYLGSTRWEGQEMSTDEFICPTRSSGDWANSGYFVRLHAHEWRPEDSFANNNYSETMQAISRCNEVIHQLNATNYGKLGLTDADKNDNIGQMKALKGYFYMRALDFYGGVPLFDVDDTEVKARATAKETFLYIEELFKEAVATMKPKEALAKSEEGYLSQACAAALLAQLYFNAEAYIGEQKYTEAAAICQDIISGKYGPYALDSTWYGIFSFDNDRSPEMIWCCPSEYNHMEFNWYWRNFTPYNCRNYFDNTYIGTGYNGYCLAPSLNPAGEPYTEANPEIKLGSPYGKFHEKDLRKQAYGYEGNGAYHGMFLIGEQINPKTGKKVMGSREDNGKTCIIRDQVFRYSKVENPTASTPSTMTDADESCGVRLIKFPIPTDAEKELTWKPDFPAIRLAEIYYTLAECKLRQGDRQGASDLINQVRKRNFENGIDPDPCTAANLDLYRMSDEWMIEFLGEGRRRTDLIRLGFFVTEDWWDHKASNNTNLNRFPLGDTALSSNPLLKQNPGYGDSHELSPDEI